MSKKTDYKKLWRKEQEKNKTLSDKIVNYFIPRLKNAEAVLLGIVYDEVDIEKLKKDYFANNPDLRENKETTEKVEASKKEEDNANTNLKS